MGRLTTHVLETAQGRPAAGLRIELYREGETEVLVSTVTNEDGRCAAPLIEGASFGIGGYELQFHAGDYFRASGLDLPDPPFLDRIVIRFGISDPNVHYHVPLLLSPYGYSTYRGS